MTRLSLALLSLLLVLPGNTGCAPPDPDARLRAGDLVGAAGAWRELHGALLDTDHPVAEILAIRATGDQPVTTIALEDAMAAVRLLEQAPSAGTRELDLSFTSFTDWFRALEALAVPPMLVVVGRSEGRGDRDPYTAGGALPWKGGRIVGWARSDVARLGSEIEGNPPARLVVVAMRDATGSVFVNLERRDGAWWTVAASRPEIAARLVLAADAIRDYGGPAPGAALRAREGAGFVQP